jgi:hypothetical protein
VLEDFPAVDLDRMNVSSPAVTHDAMFAGARSTDCTDSCTGLDVTGGDGKALDGLHGRKPQTTEHLTDGSALDGRFGGLKPL